MTTPAVHLETASPYPTQEFINVCHRFIRAAVMFARMITRALHLGVPLSYSSWRFINVYHRFIGRREICAALCSNYDTIFFGTNRVRRQLLQQASATSHKISSLQTNDGTDWRFNPPAASHFGGLWEADVKFVKRVIEEATLTFEKTMLICIEAALNYRPMQALRDDPTDLAALTLTHLLIGEPLPAIPAPYLPSDNYSMFDRLNLTRQMFEHFFSSDST